MAAFQRKQGHVLLPQGLLHIGQGHEDPLQQVGAAVVDGLVEQAQAQMAHAYLVAVREGEGHAGRGGVPVLDQGVHFAARVLGRLFHLRQQFQFQQFFIDDHADSPSDD